MNKIVTNNYDNVESYTVSEISENIARIIKNSFGYIRIKGEIAFIKDKGNLYIRIKDNEAVLDAICFSSNKNKLSYIPKVGDEVNGYGHLVTYEKNSKYQINLIDIKLSGEGALRIIFEKLKKKLQEEGIFSKPKKSISKYPKIIVIITSKTGAVIYDILNRIKERYPLVQLLLYPVEVQGEIAAEKISYAIMKLNYWQQNGDFKKLLNYDLDAIIIARGGGSAEDLWCFNDERLVRVTYASTIPIVSAIGHETDTSLIDYVSDKRVSTPTAAAEYIVPDRNILLHRIKEISINIKKKSRDYIDSKNIYLEEVIKRNIQRYSNFYFLTYKNKLKTIATIYNIENYIPNKRQELKKNFEYLQKKIRFKIKNLRINLERELNYRLSYLYKYSVSNNLLFFENKLKNISNKLDSNLDENLSELRRNIILFAAKFELYNYKNILNKGYNLLYSQEGEIIDDLERIISNKEDIFKLKLKEATIDIKIIKINKNK